MTCPGSQGLRGPKALTDPPHRAQTRRNLGWRGDCGSQAVWFISEVHLPSDFSNTLSEVWLHTLIFSPYLLFSALSAGHSQPSPRAS